MRKIKVLSIICLALLAIVGCRKKEINKLKDEVNDLKTRVTVLEETCRQNNTNIVSLQTIVNASSENDYVTSVTPVLNDGVEIGYTIAFKNQSPITIYHGKNGTNGTNGTNGVSPIIGVAEFESIYYWTLNGDWLLDDNGSKIRVTGENGTNGTNGTNGENGVTPQLKVEDDNWYVSYDNGETWNFVSQAKGDKGDQGDSMFKDVTYDDSFVYFILANDTSLKIARYTAIVSIEKGAIKAAFSVAAGKQVYFSQGNLQFQASTDTWRFAINQYDIIGEGNENVADNYAGWIDLFGWGTSGWNSGAKAYMPYTTSQTNSDYMPGNASTNNLTGAYANADWGVYNKIANGGNQAGLWRTLTQEEWEYVINGRANATYKRGVATVNGVNGMILLPDKWNAPDGIVFNPSLANDDKEDLFQTINNFNLVQWIEMEKHGAIFLPAGGGRIGAAISGNPGYRAYYWSSTAIDSDFAYGFRFNSSEIETDDDLNRRHARSVRLVQDVE